MSLDDFLDSWSEDQIEQARFERDREWDEWRRDLEQRDVLETPEAEETRWGHRMRLAAVDREPVHHVEDKRGIDRRCFGGEAS